MKSLIRKIIPLGLRQRIGSRLGRRKLRLENPNCQFSASANIGASKFGQFVVIGDDSWIFNSSIGHYTYVANRTAIANATVGKFCAIAPGAYIGLPEHPTREFVSIHPAFYSHAPVRYLDFVQTDQFKEFSPVTIGSDVWVGANALIRGGLKIGDGAIIGAGAIVTKDVEPYTIVTGVPARPLRKRFTDLQIEFLLRFKWWEKDLSWIRQNAAKFRSIDTFTTEMSREMSGEMEKST